MKFLVCTLLTALTILGSFAFAQSVQKRPSGRTIQPDLTCSPAPCRLPNTRVTQGTKINETAPNLAINSQNPSQMILAVEDTSCGSEGAAYSTNDGGSTWAKSCLPPIGVIDLVSSSWMVYDSSGVVHALVGTFNEDCGENEILETHSSDNGLTWSSLNLLRSVQFLVLDSQAMDNNSGSPFAGTIYGSSTEFVSFQHPEVKVWRSVDGGANWTATVAATLPNTFGFNSEGFSHLAIGKDGTVYLGYNATANGSSSPNEMMFTKSTDGGQTWSNPVRVYAATAVNDIPNTTVSALDAPVIDVDNSPAGIGRLYMTFYNWTGTFMQVVVTHSSDGGDSWSTPVPVAPASNTHDQFKPYISVNSTGSVAVTWLDRRDDPANVKYRTYSAISKNGIFNNRNVALATGASTPMFGSGPAASAWQGSTLFVAWPDTRPSGTLQQFIGGYKQQ